MYNKTKPGMYVCNPINLRSANIYKKKWSSLALKMNQTNQTKRLKSEQNRSDFRHCPKSELFGNETKTI